MRIGTTELILVFIVALIALGPNRLPVYAKKLGEAVSQFKKYSEEATREIKESVVAPLEEAQAPLREAVKPLEDLDKTVQGNVKDIKASFEGIGKTKEQTSKPCSETIKAGEPGPETSAKEGQALDQEAPA